MNTLPARKVLLALLRLHDESPARVDDRWHALSKAIPSLLTESGHEYSESDGVRSLGELARQYQRNVTLTGVFSLRDSIAVIPGTLFGSEDARRLSYSGRTLVLALDFCHAYESNWAIEGYVFGYPCFTALTERYAEWLSLPRELLGMFRMPARGLPIALPHDASAWESMTSLALFEEMQRLELLPRVWNNTLPHGKEISRSAAYVVFVK
jgi:hypothetical protein